MPATVSRRRANAVQLSRAKAADQWLPGYRRALRIMLRKQTRKAVDAFQDAANIHYDFQRNWGVRWAREAEALKKRWIYLMVAAGYKWAEKEVVKAATGKSDKSIKGKQIGSPGPDVPLRAVIGEDDEFLIRGRFKDIDKWVETTAEAESRTKARKLTSILNKAAKETVTVTGVGGIEYTRGVTIAEIAKRIRTAGLGADDHRASMLARTGTIWAFNEGAQQRYRSAGVTAESWVVTDDDALCFTKDVLVDCVNGRKQICDIRVGDSVRTRKGFRQVIKTFKNPGDRNLVAVMYEKKILVCTKDHPIWVNSKWVEAGKIKAGNFIQGTKNEQIEVLSVFDIPLPKTDDRPTVTTKIARFAMVLARIAMPVFSVNFNRNLHRRKNKVNRVSSDFEFLNVPDTKLSQRNSDSSFNLSLPRPLPVACDRAEDVVRRRNDPKRLSTILAGRIYRGAVAFLRAVFLCKSSRFEYLFTANAGTHTCIPISTSPTTDGHSRSGTRSDLIDFPTDRTGSISLLNSVPVALPVTVLPTCRDSSTGEKGLSASFASKLFTFYSHMILLARIYYRLFRGRSKVFNLEIEGDHTFYANGILVHNCPFCQTMDGAIVKLDDDFASAGEQVPGVSDAGKDVTLTVAYDVQHPPLHPNCRCTIVPVLTEGGEEAPIHQAAESTEISSGFDPLTDKPIEPITDKQIEQLRKRLFSANRKIIKQIDAQTERISEIYNEIEERAQWGRDGKRPDGSLYNFKADPKRKLLFNELDKLEKDRDRLNSTGNRKIRNILNVKKDRRIDYQPLFKWKQLPKDFRKAGHVNTTKKALKEVGKLVDKSTQQLSTDTVNVLFNGKRKRAQYDDVKKVLELGLNSGQKTIFHEMGHRLEQVIPGATKAAENFLALRTQGEKAVKLQKLFPGKSYKRHEITKKDKFISAYTGKQYDGGTEIISMGLQHIFEDPAGFASKDPGHFGFMIKLLRGGL